MTIAAHGGAFGRFGTHDMRPDRLALGLVWPELRTSGLGRGAYRGAYLGGRPAVWMDGMDIGPDSSAGQWPAAVSVDVRVTTLNPRVQVRVPGGALDTQVSVGAN